MPSLGTFLEQLQVRYHDPVYLSSDPLEFAHRYSDPWDREAVALLGALLAYGNVKQIRRSVEEALRRMRCLKRTPSEFIRGLDDAGFRSQAREAMKGYAHRFNVGDDLVALFGLIERSWREHGSVGAHFLMHLSPSDPNFGSALNGFIGEWRSWKKDLPREIRLQPSFDYLLTAPGNGSCCKRWCMFLRWMGRRDRLDLGLWMEGSALSGTFPPRRSLRPDQLIIPLDTHTGRISQYLGLTRRKSLDWKAAVEVTESLRACNAEDPVRFDFALSRLGILDLCKRVYRVEICRKCDLLPVCQFALKGSKKR